MDAPTRPHQRYLDRFAPLADHVRRNLRGDLSVEALARAVHFSPFHFHRLFTAVMGETVGTFVQRARLERAVQLMRTRPNRSLSHVARVVGFGSLSAFSRAFRRAYGLPPSRWDRRSRLVFRAAEAQPAPPGVPDLSELIAAGEGPPVEVRLRDVPPLTVAYVRVRRPWEPGALEGAYVELRAWLDRRGLERRELLGISWDDVEITPLEHIRYDLAAAVSPGTTGERGVVVRTLPGLVVAAAPGRGTLARIARVWDLPASPRTAATPRREPPSGRRRGGTTSSSRAVIPSLLMAVTVAFSGCTESDASTTVGGYLYPNVIMGEGLPNPNPTRIGSWATLPEGREWGSTAGMGTDPTDGHVWGYERCASGSAGGPGINCDSNPVDPIFKFDRHTGQILANFGAGAFVTPHGLHVPDDGTVWLTDFAGNEAGTEGHQVSPDGELLMSLGAAGHAGSAPGLLNQPNDVVVGPDGSIYVADGHSGQNLTTPQATADGRAGSRAAS